MNRTQRHLVLAVAALASLSPALAADTGHPDFPRALDNLNSAYLLIHNSIGADALVNRSERTAETDILAAIGDIRRELTGAKAQAAALEPGSEPSDLLDVLHEAVFRLREARNDLAPDLAPNLAPGTAASPARELREKLDKRIDHALNATERAISAVVEGQPDSPIAGLRPPPADQTLPVAAPAKPPSPSP